MKLSNKIVIEKSKELGFDLIGFSKAEKLIDETSHLNGWIDSGYHAKMNYMERNLEKRFDVSAILPGAKSIISLALNYYTNDRYKEETGFGKVSRYAWGKDYHLLIWEMLEILEEEFLEIDSTFESKSYVDTGPVMDKVWAAKSGIGWQGKNSNIISREIGSWFFIATMITNYEFEYNDTVPDFCGSCSACIDACPTQAIVKPYVIDSNRCISYLTIENREEINTEFKNKFQNWLFGCDICQDVCPWNKKFSSVTSKQDFNPVHKELKLEEIYTMDEEKFKEEFETSPIKRAKLSGLKRNANFINEREP